MQSTRRSRASLCWVFAGLLCALLVGGCSPVQEREAPPEQGPQKQDQATGGAGFETMPDPYRKSQKPLPGQAEQEFSRAQEAMENENWARAEELLTNMTAAYPELSGPYVNLGLVYRAQENFEQAEQALAKAIEVNPLNSEAYNQLAILHREQGEFEQAEKRYLQALDVWPHNPVVHRNLGILYDLYMGRLDEALEHYQMSQKLSTEEDRKLEGWIVDLQRRMADQQAAMN